MNYEKTLRKVRQRIFDYDDMGKDEKAKRVLLKLKSKLMPAWKEHKEQMKHEQGQRLLRAWA